MNLLDVNYVAVVVAAVGTFVLGALWYSPALFGKQWVAAHGYTPDQIEAMRKGAGGAYTVSFLCYLVMAWVMGVLVTRIGIDTLIGGIKLGALCWLGFAATIGLTAQMFSDRKFATYVIDAGYQLMYLLLMGMVLAVMS